MRVPFTAEKARIPIASLFNAVDNGVRTRTQPTYPLRHHYVE
jgi:hypothetical protein